MNAVRTLFGFVLGSLFVGGYLRQAMTTGCSPAEHWFAAIIFTGSLIIASLPIKEDRP